MKLPIPNDWDGKSQRCIQVLWPDSPMWLAVLHGLLSYPMRGRLWDGRTGTIIDAQAVGRDIWGWNTPLVPCVVLPPGEQLPCYPFNIEGGSLIVESAEMGQVVTDVTIEDGELIVWFGACCPQPRGMIGAIENMIVPVDEQTNDDPEEVNWACPKAYAIGHKFYEFLQSLEMLDEEWLWNWDETMQDAVGLLFDEGEVIELGLEYFIIKTLFEAFLDIEFTILERDLLICRWAKILNNETSDLSPQEWSEMKGVFGTIWDETFNLELSIVQKAWDTFNAANARKIARTAVNFLDAECPCPEGQVEIPVSYDWLHVFDFRLGTWGFEIVDGEQIDGVGVKVSDMAQYDVGPVVHNVAPATGGDRTIRFVRLDYSEWPTDAEPLAATCWYQLNEVGCQWDDEENFGQNWMAKVFTDTWGQGGHIRFGVYQATGGDTAGDNVLWRLVLAGLGADPYPDVLPSDEWT